MDTVVEQVSASLTQMLGWELIAVILAIAYLLLIMRENSWGWICALISTAIYTLLFWEVSLLMDSALNVYYMGMAVYGWLQWKTGGKNHQGVAINFWSLKTHFFAIGIIFLATLVSGYLLSENTQAAWPYLDSFTTWASVLTTYMVAKKVIENWLYWIVIDTVAIGLYIDRGLYLTTILFLCYLVICVFGYINWKKQLKANELTAA